MKVRQVIAVVVTLLVVAFVIVRERARAHQYSGPGIQGNLLALEVAKARWTDAHKGTNDSPKMIDIVPYLTNGGYQFGAIHPRYKEIYIVNKVGQPVLAYDPRDDQVYTLSSNQLDMVEEMKR